MLTMSRVSDPWELPKSSQGWAREMYKPSGLKLDFMHLTSGYEYKPIRIKEWEVMI